MTVFEHPLNERIRSFLRLQQLFIRLDYHLSGSTRCDLQAAISVLLEASELTGRSNIKTEVIKELERQEFVITNRKYPEKSVEIETGLTCNNIRILRTLLHEQTVRSYQEIQHNEFLNSVKQRCGASVSGSSYDLPLYHFWLDRNPAECRQTIIEWMQPYKDLRKAIELVMDNIRNSQSLGMAIAERGLYQDSLSRDKTLQLVRVQLIEHPDIFPEISAGIHRITIRFMRFISINERPGQELDDTKFQIAYCTI